MPDIGYRPATQLENEQARRELKTGNEVAMRVAQERGYRTNPRIAAAKLS